MPMYHVNQNAQSGGEHEVHQDGCSNAPRPENRVPLGNHANCHSAVIAARKFYTNVDGCYHCSRDCHTR